VETLVADGGDRAGEGLGEILGRIIGDPEQVHSLHALLGPFCHDCRNLLNSLKMGLYLARRQGSGIEAERWDRLERCYSEVEERFDRLHTICRPMRLTLVRMSLSLLLEDRRENWTERFAARGRVLQLVGPSGPVVGEYDPNYLGTALDAFVDWRAEAGTVGEAAKLHWWTRKGSFHVEWNEINPKRGSRQNPGVDSPEPLALPLLARVIAAHGGSLENLKSAGRHVRLCWPQVAASSMK